MLDIFATDPEAKAQRDEREAAKDRATRPEYAFQLRSGKMNGRQPVSLRQWRVTTPKLDVAQALKELYGGKIGEAPNGDYAVDTETDKIEVVVNVSQIESKLIQWADGLPVHECDGSKFLSPDEDKGKPCGCPRILAERKEKAKQRRGPKPNIVIPLTLAQDEDLGLGRYTATAWSFAEDLPYTMKALERIDCPALCVLRLEHVEYTTKAGEKREFTKPVLDVKGSFNDAITEDPHAEEPPY